MKKHIFIVFIVMILLFASCTKIEGNIDKENTIAEDTVITNVTSEYFPETGKVLLTWKGDENQTYQIYSKKKNESDNDYVLKGEVKGLTFEDTHPFAGDVIYKIVSKDETKSMFVKGEDLENTSTISLNDFIGINNGIVKNFDHRIKGNNIFVNDEEVLENVSIDIFSLLALGLSDNVYENEYIYIPENNFENNSSKIHILKINKYGNLQKVSTMGNLPFLIIFIKSFKGKLIIGGYNGNATLIVYNLLNPEDPELYKNYNLMPAAQTASFGESEDYYYVIYFGGSDENSGIFVQFIDRDFNLMEDKKFKISDSPYIINFSLNQNEYIINDGINKYYFKVTDNFSSEDIISVNYDFTTGNCNYTSFYSFDGNKLYTVNDKKIKIYKLENNTLSLEDSIDINYDEKIDDNGNYIEHPAFMIINKVENYLNISILYFNSTTGFSFEVSKYYYYIYDIEKKEIVYSDFNDSESADENYRKINPIVFKYN